MKKKTITKVQLRNSIGAANGDIEVAAKMMFTSPEHMYESITAIGYTPEHFVIEMREEQKRRDVSIATRKSSREFNRDLNLVEQLNKSLIECIGLSKFKVKRVAKTPRLPKSITDEDNTLIVQISDTHFGEVIDLPNNKFDMKIASQAIAAHIKLSLLQAKSFKVSKVVLVLTGDLVNSWRRKDENMTNSDTLSSVILMATRILSGAIEELNLKYPVTVASIVGNESRFGDSCGSVDKIVSESFDFVIHNILELMFKDVDDVTFIPMGDPSECLLRVSEHNILLVHGHFIGKSMETGVTKLYAKYATRGISLDQVLSGHIHSAYISDNFSRSSGLPGSNSYSDITLGLMSKKSQNCYLVGKELGIIGIKNDLTHYENYQPYPFDIGTVINVATHSHDELKQIVHEI
jgi:predicted phosphodiesterase